MVPSSISDDTFFKDRLALITGASRGLGRALSIALAAKGAKLVLVAKTTGGLEETDDLIRAAQAEHGLPEIGATLVPLDLSEGDHIDGLAANLYQRFERLDILIANAAILGNLTPLSHVEPDRFNQVIQINLAANYRLIRAMEPLLRQSKIGARALFIGCAQQEIDKAYWGAYAASKAGLQAMVSCWGQEVAHANIKAHYLPLGAMATNMRLNAFPGRPMESWPSPMDEAVPKCLAWLSH